MINSICQRTAYRNRDGNVKKKNYDMETSWAIDIPRGIRLQQPVGEIFVSEGFHQSKVPRLGPDAYGGERHIDDDVGAKRPNQADHLSDIVGIHLGRCDGSPP